MRYKRKEPVLQVGDTIRCHDKDEMVNIPSTRGIITDIRNKILCVIERDRYLHIYSYSKNKTIKELKKFDYGEAGEIPVYRYATLDSIHRKLYVRKMVNGTLEYTGDGHIDFSDLKNIERVTSDSFDNDPVFNVYYYDVINNITYVETHKGVWDSIDKYVWYSIDKDGVATEQKYFSNFGTNDRIEIDANGHQLIHLNPEGKIFDNGKIIDYDHTGSKFTYMSINENLLT